MHTFVKETFLLLLFFSILCYCQRVSTILFDEEPQISKRTSGVNGCTGGNVLMYDTEPSSISDYFFCNSDDSNPSSLGEMAQLLVVPSVPWRVEQVILLNLQFSHSPDLF